MTSSARRFRTDSLRTHAAITRQYASSTKGRRARRLALAAYADYVRAGSGWAAAGQARLSHHRAAAKRAASAAAAAANAGGKLLVLTGKLLH